MDTPLTPKEEAFARNVAAGMSATDAYRTAYEIDPERQNLAQEARKIAQRPRVAERIEQLRSQLVEHMRENLTFELSDLMRKACEVYDFSKNLENPAGMIGALNLMAKANGLLVENRANDRKPIAGNLNRDQAVAALAALAAIRKAREGA